MSWLLRFVLSLAPRDFRDSYGDEIVALLEKRSRQVAARSGALGLMRFWLFHLVDLLGTVVTERSNERWRRRDNQRRKRTAPMANIMRDLGHAARSLRRDSGFAAVAIITLALGIGANTAVFSVVNGVMLRPLPYPEPDRLITVWSELPGFGFDRFSGVTDAQFLHYGERSRTVEMLAAYRGSAVRLTGEGEAERINAADVTANLLTTLGVAPAIGRGFIEAETRPGGPQVAVLTHELWTRRFANDPGVVGRAVNFDETPTEIVGVMPAGFRLVDPDVELLRPLRIDRDQLVGTSFNIQAVGRLVPGVTHLEASVEFNDLIGSLPETDPTGFFTAATIEQGGLKPDIHLLKDDVVGTIGTALWLLLGTVGLVMLIACANVANLFLVRAEGRQKEVAVRVALGANRGGIARLFLTESVVLGLVAGLFGLGVAWAGTRALVAYGPQQLPGVEDIRLDATVVWFTVGISVISGFLFGAFPAWRHSRPELGSTLQQEGRSGMVSRERQRIRGGLVITQVALALVLLIGSGLMVRSLVNLSRVDPGFSTSGILTFRLSPPFESYQANTSVVSFYSRLLERLGAIPGVEFAGAASRLPLFVGSGTPIRPEGVDVDPNEIPPVISNSSATPGFFRAAGIPVLAGRTFEPADQDSLARNVIVSRGFVERFWPGETGVGMRVRVGTPDDDPNEDPWLNVVGVVGDVRGRGLTEDLVEQIYFPYSGRDPGHAGRDPGLAIMVATTGDPALLVAPVRQAVRDLDDGIPVTDVESIDEVLADSMATTTFTMSLLAIAAGVALLLGTVGIYGVIAYVVSQRTREIGVRMALGAKQGAVSRMVLRQGGIVIGAGVLVGLGAAIGLTRLMESLLFGVEATDLATFGAAAVLICLVSLVASYVPARRAARVDPVEALRGE